MEENNQSICKSLEDINSSIKQLKQKEKSKPKINNIQALGWICVGIALIYTFYKVCF